MAGLAHWLLFALACNGNSVDPKTRTAGTSTPTGTTGTTPVGPTPPGVVPFAPAPAALSRITEQEWRNAAEDLFGVRYEGVLPVDYLLYNYSRVGGSELAIPPLDLEQYEAAAWYVAEHVVVDEAGAEALLGCPPTDAACVRAYALTTATRAWRHPAPTADLDTLTTIHASVLAEHGPVLALQAAVAGILLAPDFVYRVEFGAADAAKPAGWNRLTSYEVASRLASFVTASIPDDALIAAAAAGTLDTPAGIEAEAIRLVGTPRGIEAMKTFFAETIELHEIDAVTKDRTLYPEFTEPLKDQMAMELLLLFADVAIERDVDMGELLTSETAWVGPELGALYGRVVGEGLNVIDGDPRRGGLLGRAAFLTIQSHNTTTSPTYRGKFVRTRLLCHDIPPPPPGVITELPEVVGGTLRQEIEQHALDPVCAPCHLAIDPPGFALEHFDPVGRWRDLDNGLPIDATGEVDGADFDGAAELGAVLAAHPDYPKCMARQLYRFATATVDRIEDAVMVEAIATDYVEAGERFRSLVGAIVKSDAFRYVSAPLGAVCTTDGATQACSSACGTGTETCVDGRFTGCTAPGPARETCNNVDDDCNGATDDGVEQVCDGTFGIGTQACDAGEWAACDGVGPGDEVCNGLDDDGDIDVDEELEVAVTPLTYTELSTVGHYACNAQIDAFSPACHAAANRACAATGCAVTGYGPVVLRPLDVDVACFDATEAVVIGSTFTALSTHHPGCTTVNRQGGDCNAAISRMCGGLGHTTGFGPVENSGDIATVVCTPQADVHNGSYAVLSTYDASCNAVGGRTGMGCNHAIHQWCRSMSYETGHGPLENSGDLAVVACMGVL